MRRPVTYAALAAVLIILSGYYLFGIEFGSSHLLDYLNENVPAAVSTNSADPSFDVHIKGQVISVREKNSEYHQIIMRVTEVEENPAPKEEILVNLYGELPYGIICSDLAGRMINTEAELTLPAARCNPGCFDYRLYLKTKRIYITGVSETESLEISDETVDETANFLSRLRGNFIGKIREYSDDETASLTSAMLFGDKSQLDEDLYETFQKNGTAHILAVSGIHIGIIYAFISFMWRGKKRGIFSVFVTVFLLMYACLSEFSPSVMRAVIMIIIHIVSKLLHRRYDLLSAASVTCLMMLLNNPMQLFNIGFQLSFGAVTVLSVLIPVCGKGIKGSVILAISFQLAMMPFTAYCFNYFSLISVLINYPVMLLADLMIPAGVILLAASAFPADMIMARGTGVMAGLSDILTGINRSAFVPNLTNFDTASPPIWAVVMFYGLFFMGLNENVRIRFIRKQYFRIAVTFMVCICISIVSFTVTDDGFGSCSAVFLDVGQGDCLLVKDIDGRNYLFDGGGKETFYENSKPFDVGKKILKPALLKNGITKIDAAFVTHLHADHYDGIRSLAEQGFIKRLCVYEANSVLEEKLTEETGLDRSKLIYACKGNVFRLAEDVFVEVLWPEHMTKDKYRTAVSESADENAISLIMKIKIKGISILMTGDIDEAGERILVEKYGSGLQSDILKIPHHGSKYSSSGYFLDAVNPKIAVIQVGKNTYGHPSRETLDKLTERGITTYRTDLNGAAGIEPAASGMKIRTLAK